jgi:hypothetical protein
MWVWRQRFGTMTRAAAGATSCVGYSGAGEGKNNPALQTVPDAGPIPVGLYSIEEPEDTVTHGPFVLPLRADPANAMHGRSGFLIHGDSVVDPGTASKGCIILARPVREEIWASADHVLVVLPE